MKLNAIPLSYTQARFQDPTSSPQTSKISNLNALPMDLQRSGGWKTNTLLVGVVAALGLNHLNVNRLSGEFETKLTDKFAKELSSNLGALPTRFSEEALLCNQALSIDIPDEKIIVITSKTKSQKGDADSVSAAFFANPKTTTKLSRTFFGRGMDPENTVLDQASFTSTRELSNGYRQTWGTPENCSNGKIKPDTEITGVFSINPNYNLVDRLVRKHQETGEKTTISPSPSRLQEELAILAEPPQYVGVDNLTKNKQ
jgi:hypothetical protein